MKRLVIVILPAFVLCLGPATTVRADPYADSHGALARAALPAVNSDDADDGDDALGAPDFVNGDATTYTTLGCNLTAAPPSFPWPCEPPLGSLILNFDDNVCFGLAGNDLIAYDAADNELIDVTARLNGSDVGSGTDPGSAGVDLTGLVDGAPFNQVFLESPDTSGPTLAPGADIDAVECLSTLDQGDIVKVFANHFGDSGSQDEINQTAKGGFDAQQFKAFTIEITNNTGVNGGLAGLTFIDAVPAEWDLDGAGEDSETPIPVNGVCVDNVVCDGVWVTSGACTATGAEHTNSGKSGKPQLQPEIVTIDAGGLDDAATCTIKVWVMTDDDHPGKGKNPEWTPTSCPVTLNDGVKVFDASMNLLLQDDDSLIFDDGDPVTEGFCNEAL